MRYLLFLICLSSKLYAVSSPDRNIGLTISGGVSLGSYEAGFAYYLTESLKKNKLEAKFRPKYYTGASAGGINSLLALIESCSFGRNDIDESLFWKIWVPIGINELVNKNKVGPVNVFTREKMREVAETAKMKFSQGLKKGCSGILGIALTRLKPDYVKFEKNIAVPDMGQYVVVKIVGQGKGVTPKISNFPIPDLEQKQIILPFAENGSER